MTNEKLERGISKLDNNSKNVHGIIKHNCIAENNFLMKISFFKDERENNVSLKSSHYRNNYYKINVMWRGYQCFPGGSVVVCLPVQETWVRSRIIPHATGQLSPCTAVTELQRLRAAATEPMCQNYWSSNALEAMLQMQQEKTLQWETCTPQLE